MRTVFTFLALGVVAACSGSGPLLEDDPSCEGRKCDDGEDGPPRSSAGVPLVTVPGAEVIGCWVEASDLMCQYTPVPVEIFGGTVALINFTAADATFFSAILTDSPGTPVKIRTLTPAAYPVQGKAQVIFAPPSGGLGGLDALDAELTVVSPTADRLSLVLPFDIWPIAVESAPDVVSAVFFAGTEIALAPFTVAGQSALAPEHHSGFIDPGAEALLYVPVPRGATELVASAIVSSNDRVPVTFTGPGRYRAEGTGIRAVDVSAPTPTPGPTEPLPTCGLVQQTCCGGFGGTCATGGYCVPGTDVCRACGGPGQDCCGSFGGTCQAGAYCQAGGDQCRSCGAVGQDCCGGFNGTCDTGGHCEPGGDRCVAD